MSGVKRREILRALTAALPFSAAAWAGTLGQRSLYFTVEEGDKLIGGLTEKTFAFGRTGSRSLFSWPSRNRRSCSRCWSSTAKPLCSTRMTSRQRLSAFWMRRRRATGIRWRRFSQESQIHVDFTRLKGEIKASFSGLGQPFWGEVNTYDAVFEVLDKLGLLPGRKVLILIGSGLNRFSAHTLGEVQKKMEATNATVFTLGAGTLLRGQYDPYLGSSARMELLQAEAFFNMLARKSGGQAFFPRFETAYQDIAKGIVTMLQHQYRMLYESRVRPDDKFHRLKLEAFQIVDDKRRDFRVRVREGWRWQ